MCCAYIVQDLLVATSTASAKVLIGQAACYAGVCTLAESVHQNCVLGRCANLCSIIVLHLPSLMEKKKIGYGQFYIKIRCGGGCYTVLVIGTRNFILVTITKKNNIKCSTRQS